MMLVKDVMLSIGNFPVIGKTTILKEALEEMNAYKLGIVSIVDENKKLMGIFTDGDIRRQLLSVQKPSSAFFIDDALDHAIKSPVVIGPEDETSVAVKIMGEKQVWDLPVVDGKGVIVGLLHLHPIVKKLIEG